MSQIISPHDRLFKTAMKDIRVAREFFETYLPDNVRQLIDLQHLTLHPNSYIDEELKSSASDILYETKIGHETAYLFLLAEHQSTPDELMPFRLLKYMIRIWDDHLKQTGDKKLPLIVPVVFYHGHRPYTYSQDMRDLIAAPRDLVEQVLFAPFHLVDTHDIPDQSLREQYWFGTMAFFMKHIFARDFLPYLKDALSMLRQLEQSEGSNFVVSLLNYVVTTAEIPQVEQFVEIVKEGLSTPTGEKIMTIAEQLIERGKQWGREQGIQQGELQGEQRLLMKQLHHRFSKLNPDYEIRVKNARAEELSLWGERILNANSVDAIFEG